MKKYTPRPKENDLPQLNNSVKHPTTRRWSEMDLLELVYPKIVLYWDGISKDQTDPDPARTWQGYNVAKAEQQGLKQ